MMHNAVQPQFDVNRLYIKGKDGRRRRVKGEDYDDFAINSLEKYTKKVKQSKTE